MSSQKVNFCFNEEQPVRLDKFLAEKLTNLSREKVQALIAEGMVLVNDRAVLKGSYKAGNGQLIQITLLIENEKELRAEALPLDLLYEDQNVIVINKPAGLVVHPGAGHQGGTLVNALLHAYPEIAEVGEASRPGIVHRLDADTSGVLVVARTQAAYEWLVRQFKSRRTIKKYIALVDGKPPTPTGRIEAEVGRHSRFRQKMAVTYEGRGRKAISEYRTLREFDQYTLLEIHPITGRTHQIRVHLAYLGNPVAGDKVYGRRKPSLSINRFFLHAASLELILPDNKNPSCFEAPLPEELAQVIRTLEEKDRS